MTRAACFILDNGDILPSLAFKTVTGEQMRLPHDFRGHWGIFLIYRGEW